MRMILLGTAGYHPSDSRQTSCVMIPELGIVLDAGTAMYRVRDHLCTPDLHIILSHTHLDHVIGLTYLFDVVRGKKVREVYVYAEEAKQAVIEQHLFATGLFPARPAMTFRSIQKQQMSLPHGGQLTSFPLNHPGGAMGYRLDWAEHSIAYVTDTTAREGADYAAQLTGVDVLIHECNFPDGQEELARKTGHSCLSPVATIARDAQVKRLVLTHFDPLLDESVYALQVREQKIFQPIELGYDGMELEF